MQYVRNLKNFNAEQPYQQAVYYLSLIVSENAWTKDEILKSVEYLTIDRLQSFIPQLLSKLHVECLIHGNVNKERAQEIVDIVEKRLTSNSALLPILPRQLLRVREIQLLDGEKLILTISLRN